MSEVTIVVPTWFVWFLVFAMVLNLVMEIWNAVLRRRILKLEKKNNELREKLVSAED